jgi:plastocyanin
MACAWIPSSPVRLATRARLGIALGVLAVAGLGVAVVRAGVEAHDIGIVDYAFQPRRLDVEVGEPVTWTNQAGRNHTVTSEEGSELGSGELGPGEAYGHVFEQPGTYRYVCEIHPDQMTGVVRVVASTATVAPGTPEPTPPTGTLPPNFSPFPTLAPVETPAASSGPAVTPAASPGIEPGGTATGDPTLFFAVALAVIVVAGAIAFRNVRTRRS